MQVCRALPECSLATGWRFRACRLLSEASKCWGFRDAQPMLVCRALPESSFGSRVALYSLPIAVGCVEVLAL